MGAAVAAARRRQGVFDDMVDLGLVDGHLTGRLAVRTAIEIGPIITAVTCFLREITAGLGTVLPFPQSADQEALGDQQLG